MFEFDPQVKALLLYLITNGVKSVFALFKVEISGFGSIVVAALGGAFLVFASSLLAVLSPAAQNTVGQILNLVVIILAGAGVHYSAKSVALRISNGQ